ncbi:MAG: hypothetical protein HQK65_13140 [Desulfamplus sp.]|nr:hypothetical protein [Desulfamplus sp.]
MDKEKISKAFISKSLEVVYISFAEIDFRTMCFTDEFVLYTSSEDSEYQYKSYIEDVCFGLKLQGAILIPDYSYLRAHSNKVFMEILRDLSLNHSIKNIRSFHFGCVEDLKKRKDELPLPSVIKGAGGAKSSNVALLKDTNDFRLIPYKISKTLDFFSDIWDLGRQIKHKGYVKESRHRGKFIIQNFIPDLSNDWKILVFGQKYYVLNRKTRKNDFRASGSGLFAFETKINIGLLNFAEEVFKCFDVPFISIDVGFDGNCYYLLEFQAVFFGTYTIEESKCYFFKDGGIWVSYNTKSQLEEVFVDSVFDFIMSKYNPAIKLML